jgi:hypothetical protein
MLGRKRRGVKAWGCGDWASGVLSHMYNPDMKSPFPGMDPYLEQHWRDIHARLVVYSCGALQRQLGGSLRARIEERLIVESAAEESREIYPDVRVFERGVNGPAVAPDGGVAMAEPLVVSRKTPVPQRYIEIIDVGMGGKLVTMIEFMSPSNKLSGDARDKYLQKQQEILDAKVNLVEIDLTRTGRREMGYPVSNLPEAYQASPYLACVFRGFAYDRFEFYRLPLRERLKAIKIPLRETDKDVLLDLQPLIEQAYVEGAYDDIDYRRECVPPLEREDAAWADELLRSAGKR